LPSQCADYCTPANYVASIRIHVPGVFLDRNFNTSLRAVGERTQEQVATRVSEIEASEGQK